MTTLMDEVYFDRGGTTVHMRPSDPPHFKPAHKCESRAGARVALLASMMPRKVFRTASESMVNSEPLCC
jgi:hypothetical protein